MKLLLELTEISRKTEMSMIIENLGNLGKLGLGSMVNAFKQSYSAYQRGRSDSVKNSSPVSKNFSMENGQIGKDSETTDDVGIKNWMALKKVYIANQDRLPLATIFSIDGKPSALMIGSQHSLESINDKVAIAWDFSKIDISDEEAEDLTKGLNKSATGNNYYRISDIKRDPKVSKTASKETVTSYNKPDKEIALNHEGFAQTVREIVPFINNLATVFGSRLKVKLILADKQRSQTQSERSQNRKVEPRDVKLFKDTLSVRLAKFKNSKVDTAEDAEDFIRKVFNGGLKKLTLAGRTYSAIPDTESNPGVGTGKHKYFYNGTMQDLFKGKAVSMKFSADTKTGDYHSLYLSVKLVSGSLKAVTMTYNEADADGNYGKNIKINL